ncbi:MAG: hypothetical protein HY927_01400 [Elusimicrobia bacterium]|nr:hypothetical protein [Elusimicrobiota bacterium]
MIDVTHLVEDFLALTRRFIPRHEGIDSLWEFWLKEGRAWTRVLVRRYRETYFITGGDGETIEHPDPRRREDPERRARLRSWLESLRQWESVAARDPVGAQARLSRQLPLSARRGVLLRRNVRALLPDWLPIERDLSARELKAVLAVADRPDPPPIPAMTAERYFEYCRVAYRANPASFRGGGFKPGLAGRDYYRRFADGRDAGLLKVDPRSKEAFRRWHTSGERAGAHPWEIYRGGNSTHIDLYARDHPAGGWSIGLDAFSSTRLVETCRIAVALEKAKLPFCLAHRESYKLRLLQEDWVGVEPEGSEMRYAWQGFPQEWGVADCVQLRWIYEAHPGRRRELSSRLRHLVSWLPERVSAFRLRDNSLP